LRLQEIELIKDGKDVAVTDKNKEEYAKQCLQYYLGSTEKQMNSIKMGFKQFVPFDILQELFDPVVRALFTRLGSPLTLPFS